MRGLEQVARLVGGAGRSPRPLEDLGPRRDGRRRGGRSALRDAADQQALLVGQPAHGGAEERVEGQALDLRHVSLHRADPQAHVIGVPDGEGEAPAVHGPGHIVDLGVRRQIEGRLGSALDLDQARRGGPVPPVDAVDHGIDPHAGQLVHRRRQLGEGRIGDGIGQEQVLAGRRGPHPGELRRVEHLQHLLGGRLPPGYRWGDLARRADARRHHCRHGHDPGQETKHGLPPRVVARCQGSRADLAVESTTADPYPASLC